MITSKLEQPYQKQHNQIDINHLKDQFLLGLLNLPMKECVNYEYEKHCCTFCCSDSEFVFISSQYDLFQPSFFLLFPLFFYENIFGTQLVYVTKQFTFISSWPAQAFES